MGSSGDGQHGDTSHQAISAPRYSLALFIFDREDYARAAAESIAKQQGLDLRRIWIFQDGRVHRSSSVARTTTSALDNTLQAVVEALPDARVVRRSHNLGIEKQMRTSLNQMLKSSDADLALALEEDVVLSPAWTSMMLKLGKYATDNAGVGFFSAHGTYGADMQDQFGSESVVKCGVPHLRAYGQTRAHFYAVDRFLRPVTERLDDVDYGDREARFRVFDELLPFFESFDSLPHVYAQDALREWASWILGFSAIQTEASWARYIGEVGLHEDSTSFERMRYSRTFLQPDAVSELTFPDSAALECYAQNQRARFEDALKRRRVGTARMGSISEAFASQMENGVNSPIVLTLPKEEATLLETCLKRSSSYLEFGSGGSTLSAARVGVPFITTVETDADFMDRIKLELENSLSHVQLIHVDLGPTKEWGYPVDNRFIKDWFKYFMSPWSVLAQIPSLPDLVLIDGRFRVASFLATWLHVQPGTTILFDDYVDRSHYHDVESLAKADVFVGRMALFEKSRSLESAEVHQLVEMMMRFGLDPR